MKGIKEELEKFLFKLYFEMYKDHPTSARSEFRKLFVKKHGNYKYLNELLTELQYYQVEKYKQTIWF